MIPWEWPLFFFGNSSLVFLTCPEQYLMFNLAHPYWFQRNIVLPKKWICISVPRKSVASFKTIAADEELHWRSNQGFIVPSFVSHFYVYDATPFWHKNM